MNSLPWPQNGVIVQLCQCQRVKSCVLFWPRDLTSRAAYPSHIVIVLATAVVFPTAFYQFFQTTSGRPYGVMFCVVMGKPPGDP